MKPTQGQSSRMELSEGTGAPGPDVEITQRRDLDMKGVTGRSRLRHHVGISDCLAAQEYGPARARQAICFTRAPIEPEHFTPLMLLSA